MSTSDLLSLFEKNEDLHFKNAQRYKEFFDNSPLFIFELDDSGIFITINPAGIKELDLQNGSEIIGGKFCEFPLNENKQEVEKTVKKTYKGNCELFEFKTQTSKGLVKYFKTKLIPLKTLDGKVFRVLGIAEDISAMKNLKDTLDEREQQFLDIIELSPIAIAIHSNAQLVYANKSFLELVNAKSIYEVIGKPALDFVHPDFKKIVQNRLNKAAKHGKTIPLIEEKFVAMDGQVLDVEVTGKYIKYNGQPATLGLIRNITHQKISENALRESEKKYSELVRENPDAIVSLNDNGVFLTFNPAAERLSGIQAVKVLGNTMEVVNLLKPNSLEKALREFRLLVSGKERRPFELEINNLRRPWLVAEANPKLIKQEDGSVVIQFTLRDITERKLIEEELKKSNEELAAFIYRASHDLRAPLRSLLGLIELLKIEKKPDVINQYIQHMLKSVNKLDSSIGDMLEVTKTNKIDPDFVKIDFESLINQTLKGLRNLDNFNQIVFQINISNKEDFYSDRMFLEAIFNNTISNAIKYHRTGHGKNVQSRRTGHDKPFIKILVRANHVNASIIISDNGLGIDMKIIDRVFEMFFRGSDKSFGTGLGLYIVKNVVEKLRGKITLKSELGKGTKLQIKLPNNVDKKP